MNHLVNQQQALSQTSFSIVKAQILSVGTYLPEQRVKSDDIMEDIQTDLKYGMPCDWMSREMGIEERRMASDELKPSDLAILAATEALDNCAAINPDEIDAIIFCGIERDQPEPATAHTIQNALGLKAHHVFDVANACYGFVDGVKLATALIETSMVRNALVVTGEVSTQILKAVASKMKKGVTQESAKNLWGMLSLGDGAGAMVIGQSYDTARGFQIFNQRCDSKQVDRCYYKFHRDGSVDAHMQMAQIVARGFQLSKSMYEETLGVLGWDSLDWVLTHQTGKRTIDQALSLRGITDEKLTRTYPNLGNITTATLPISFKILQESGNLKKGDRIGGLFAGSGLVTGQFGYIV